ncbi:MAG: UTP--glucose-1-phosphate uridylyltransferase [Pirellulales bacterium]
MNPTDLIELVTRHGQQHLLAHWGKLTPEQRESLEEQIRTVDFAQLEKLRTGETKGLDWGALAARAKNPPAVRIGRPFQHSAEAAMVRGEQALRAGEVGAVLVAGGQGTRLGFDQPKGMFPIGPVSKSTLFQILLEKLIAVGRRYGVRIPLFLMTSPATHDETISYLAENNRFGLPQEDLVIFCQGTMPAVDKASGKLLLAEPVRWRSAPMVTAVCPRLLRSPAAAIIRDRKLKHLFYFQVDNPLVTMCDPTFLGYHLLTGSEASTQVVAKQDPAERVGVLADIDGRTQIIEYSDLPAEQAARREADGSLALWAGNTAVHVFDAEFLLRMTAETGGLPFHVAHKKVPYVGEAGQIVEPQQPNALKFEKFIFDLLPACAADARRGSRTGRGLCSREKRRRGEDRQPGNGASGDLGAGRQTITHARRHDCRRCGRRNQPFIGGRRRRACEARS